MTACRDHMHVREDAQFNAWCYMQSVLLACILQCTQLYNRVR